MKRSKSDYRIQTVTNALRVMEQFREEQELGVTELSRRLGLHKNNVFRLLATLEERGYVTQLPTGGRYRLGAGCLELGHAFARERSLVRQAQGALLELARATGESAHLGTLQDGEVAHLLGEQPDQLVTTSLRVGRRLDAHCTALGKVLLAGSPLAVRERFARERIGSGELPRRTPSTITDRDKFFDHLTLVAGQGYAVDVEETDVGLCCASAPVHDAGGTVVAALSVSGPAFRLGPQALVEQAVPRVVAAAEKLSLQLGYVAS